MSLVLLHGFFGAPSDWKSVQSSLPSTIRVATPSFVGEEDPARAVAASLESPCVIAGYSMGGRVALRIALARPDLVRGLVMVSSSPGLEDEAERAKRVVVDEVWAKRLEQEPADDVLKAWYDQALFDSLRARPEIFEAMLKRRRSADIKVWAPTIRAMSPGRIDSLWNQLPNLAAPIHWVAGSLDTGYVDIAQRASRLSVKGSHSIVPRAGHALHLEAPEALAAGLVEFVERIQS